MNMHSIVRPLKACCISAAVTCLAACAAGPDFKRPASPQVDGYLPGQRISQAAGDRSRVEDAEGAQPWWTAFGSDKLDKVVHLALTHSPTLDEAQATLRQAEFSLKAGEGVFYPDIDLGASAVRQRSTPFKQGVATGLGGLFNLYTLGATITYNLDIAGVQRRTVEGLQAQVDGRRYVAAASYLTLTSNVVNACIAHAAYARQLQLTQEVAEREQRQARLIQVQIESGVAGESAYQTQRQLLKQTQASASVLAQKVAQTEHLLSTLLGRTASEGLPLLPGLEELHMPQNPPLSLPSDLVRQRPDILQAEAELHASYAALGVASGALWPSVSLGAGGGWADTHFEQLGETAGRFWSIGPSVNLPIMNGGALGNHKRAAEAAVQSSEASYRLVVLQAFEQVADTLTALQNDDTNIQASRDAEQAAQRNGVLSQRNHQAGLTNEVQWLVGEITWIQASANHVQAQAQQLQDSVALYTALGAHWWHTAPDWLQTSRAADKAGEP